MNPSKQCRRFQTILDWLVYDEGPLSDEDRTFLAQHAAECTTCAGEAAVITGLQEAGPEALAGPVDDSQVHVMAQQLVQRAQEAEPKDSSAVYPWRSLLAVSGLAALLIAASWLLGWFESRPSSDQATEKIAEIVKPAPGPAQIADHAVKLKLTWTSGEVFAPDVPALAANDLIRTGAGLAALTIESQSLVILNPKSELAIEQARMSAISLRLDQGKASFRVSPRKAGQKFEIATAMGMVRVIGTTFSVEIVPPSVEIRVAEGLVEFAPQAGSVARISAGQVWRLGGRSRELSKAEQKALTQLFVQAQKLPDPKAGKNVAKVLGLRSMLNPGKQPPKTKAVKPRKKPKKSRDPKRQPASEARRPSSEPKGRSFAKSRLPVKDYMELARDLSAARQWSRVVATYQSLIRSHPMAPEAYNSMVSMGQIQLKQLKQPGRALISFEKYLRFSSQGPLAEEANWGMIRCLRKLGEPEQERKACLLFLKRFPRSLYASKVRKRINDINAAQQ